MQPLVQVFTMAYNHAPYIRQTIESILAQKTDFPFQLLIHDDASTDGTAEIIQEYARKYPDKVVPILETENQYSKGLDIFIFFIPYISAKYLAQCDGDDYWCDETKLQRQADYMQAHPECVMCIHNAYDLIDGVLTTDHATSDTDRIIPAEEVIERGGGPCFNTSSVMLRRDILRSFPEELTAGEVGDVPTKYYAVTKGTIYCIARFMSCYRHTVPGSWTVRTDHSRKYKTPTAIKQKELLIAFYKNYDNYTLGQYHHILSKFLVSEEAKLLLLQRRLKEVKKPPYSEYYRSLPLKIRIIEHLDCYTPKLLALYRKLKYSIVR